MIAVALIRFGASADELSLDECLRVAGELVALGCRHNTLIGGEPTLYPGWHEVGRRLVELAAKVNMLSNGLHWSPQHLKQAKEAGLCAVGFSLDGFEKEHDEFRFPGSFERMVRAIDMCVAAGMRTAVNTTINRLNQGSVKEMRTFLMEHGVSPDNRSWPVPRETWESTASWCCVQKICCG